MKNEEKLYQLCQDLSTTLANLAFEDKKQILQGVVGKIIVNGDEVTICGVVPAPNKVTSDSRLSCRHLSDISSPPFLCGLSIVPRT